jgi:Zn-finger nucleic acid-binding protein
MGETGLLCPRCQARLFKDKSHLKCERCEGILVGGEMVCSELINQLDVVTSPQTQPVDCPKCSTTMQILALDSFELDYCTSCQGVWLDAGEQLSAAADSASALSRYLLYSFTLPERLVRSSVGLAAGAAKETASFLVPQAFKSAKTYQLVVENSLGFLTRDIGGVDDGSARDEDTQAQEFMARKAVGNFVDLAGMATLHVSPVWILAIVSDVAYGTKSYVTELASELQKQGLIDDTSTVHNVDDILDAIQNATGEAASLFDTPPLSVDELRRTLNTTREAITAADYTSVLPESEIQGLWQEMRTIATREDVSLLGVSGAVTMSTLNKVATVSKGTLTGIQVVGDLFSRNVIGHYVESLNTVRERGFYQSVKESSQPYVASIWTNLAADRSTWTEEVLSGRAIRKGLSAISGLFQKKT